MWAGQIQQFRPFIKKSMAYSTWNFIALFFSLFYSEFLCLLFLFVLLFSSNYFFSIGINYFLIPFSFDRGLILNYFQVLFFIQVNMLKQAHNQNLKPKIPVMNRDAASPKNLRGASSNMAGKICPLKKSYLIFKCGLSIFLNIFKKEFLIE